MKILIGICGIGNGHLSRQTNVINLLMSNNHEIVIATTENNINYFKNKFPKSKVLEISIPWIACNSKGIDFETSIKKYIKEEIEKVGIKLDNIDIVRPPKEEMGDFAIPCFTISIDGEKNPHDKANAILEKLNMNEDIISDVKVIGPYLNFTINRDFLAKETLEAIGSEENNYGSNKIGNGKELLIEHTSINPNASPHIGRSRNSIIGDFLVRLYKFEGYNVEANYFINDIGKQISMLLVGVEKLGNIKTITFSDMLKLYIEINDISKKEKEVEEKIELVNKK